MVSITQTAEGQFLIKHTIKKILLLLLVSSTVPEWCLMETYARLL